MVSRIFSRSGSGIDDHKAEDNGIKSPNGGHVVTTDLVEDLEGFFTLMREKPRRLGRG
jgi:hypothetical protein